MERENIAEAKEVEKVKEKRLRSWLIPASLFVAAILVIMDQVVRHGVIWEWRQVLHHENLALVLVSLAVGMLLSQKVSERKGDNREQAKTQ